MNICIHINCRKEDVYKKLEEFCLNNSFVHIDYEQSWDSWVAEQNVKEQMGKYIVIICREGKSEIIHFEKLEDAIGHADVHGAGWSETFVCEILMGPIV